MVLCPKAAGIACWPTPVVTGLARASGMVSHVHLRTGILTLQLYVDLVYFSATHTVGGWRGPCRSYAMDYQVVLPF